MGFKKFLMSIFREKGIDKDHIHYIRLYSKHQRTIPRSGAIIKAKGKYLLVKNINSEVYGFPKGKREQGEKDFETAIREVYEETGLDITNLIQKNKHTFICGMKYFIVQMDHFLPVQPINTNEIVDIVWSDLSDVPLQSHVKCYKNQSI